jgi:mannitol-1-phosphate/altronate dehydrogenase
MSELSIYPSAGVIARDSRRTSREISRVHGASQVRQAAIDAEVDVTLAKIDSVTTATGYSLTATARIAQAETALVQNFPGASGRVAFHCERHMLAVADCVDVMLCRVRRL